MTTFFFLLLGKNKIALVLGGVQKEKVGGKKSKLMTHGKVTRKADTWQANQKLKWGACTQTMILKGGTLCVDKADPQNYNLFKQKFLRVG